MPRTMLLLIVAIGVTLVLTVGLFGPHLGARRIIRPAPGTKLTVPAFAYAPSPYQTDKSPCFTASGARVRRGTVAANFLPMGTILKIGDNYFIVEDRMHPRYDQVIDVFKPSTAEAKQFGRQRLEITIVEYGKPGQALPSTATAALKPEVKPTKQPLSLAEPAEGVDNLITVEGQEEAEAPNLLEQWQGGFSYLQRLLRAGAPTDVNRFDVKCFEE